MSQTNYERSAAQRLRSPQAVLARLHPAAAPPAAGPAGSAPVAVPRPAQEPGSNAPTSAPIDGSLDGYVAYALRENPGLRGSLEQWRAAVHAIAERRRLPDPVISYGVFLRRVETRVGPQRQRFGARQMLPWPGKRRAAAAAAADMAAAAEHRFAGQAVTIARRVADAYWQVWAIGRIRDIEAAQRDLLAALAETIRTRIAIGKGGLADAAQVDLEVSRRDDALAALDARERSAKARLRHAIGAGMDMRLPVAAAPPPVVVPDEPDDALWRAARAHPGVTALETMAEAQEHTARAARARRMPDLTVSLDYIETGAALMDNVPDSGKDPIMLMAAVTVPIWHHTYDEAERAARAEAAALRARGEDTANQAVAELDVALTQVRDAARRIALYQNTLIPQAETAYAAVIGSLHTGESSLASALMAQKVLLELERQLVTTRADHARAWARVVEMAGRPVAAKIADPSIANPNGEETR